MQFGVLGPLIADNGGQSLALGGPKQRAVLAVLLLHANEPVSRDRLIDDVWGEHPPANPSQTLDTYVSRLRKQLGADRLARHQGGGYVLRVEPQELDLERFERLAAAGEYGQALELWRGPALGDLVFEPFAAAESERLEERRLAVLEERVDGELAARGGAELVAELEQLVREHPLRERLVGQLMLALYRAGRQAAALEVYRATRRGLAEELGLEPGPQLQELERQILAHDPALDGAPARRARHGHRRRGRMLVAALVGVAIAGGAAAAVVELTGSSNARAIPSAAGSRLLGLGYRARAAALATSLPATPAAIASGDGSLWLADPNDDVVLRVNPKTGAVADRIPVSSQPGSIAVGGRAVWAAGTQGGAIDRIDPTTDTVSQTIHLGGADTSAVAFGNHALWAADTTDHALVEIDPRTGSPLRTFTLDLRPTSLVVGEHAIWVADFDAGSLAEVDATTGQTLSTVAVGGGPAALALEDGVLWVANSLDSTVSAVDASTSRILATIPVGSGPSSIAVADGSVWVANQYSGTVSRIDARRKVVTETVGLGGEPAAVAASGRLVWVGAGPSVAAHRGGTLRLVGTYPFTTIDPAFEYSTPLQFSRFTYDSLVAFAAEPGPAGLRLVPDLALAVPTPTQGGTVYTFRLRSGIRYSDGQPLRASDFRHAIERQFRVGGPTTTNFAGIVGASACSRERCDLSRGIRTDDSAGIVSFMLTSPDPDFLFKLGVNGFAAPVPRGTPDHDVGSNAVPGTGPYRIAVANRREVKFVRNRYFREWSHAAQPDGNPDTIVWRFPRSLAAATRLVEEGKADWVDNLAPSQLPRLEVSSPAQLHTNETFAVEFLPLNAHMAPFDDVRVRRALNYAVDRRRVAQLYGGAEVATPLCQPLAPGLPGYRRYCPYTRDPNAGGAWSAPDLAKARRLVAASGTRGEHVTLWASPDEGYIPPTLAPYIASVLRSLGYRTTLKMVPFGSITPKLWRSMQVSADGDWLPDYPTPSSYLPGFFGCRGAVSNGYVCNPRLDREMLEASRLQIMDSRSAAALWNRVDRTLVDRAYWVPLVNVGTAELVSRRMGNYQFNPLGDFIADQAWVR